MEILLEFLGELFFESVLEVIQNKKITKFVRYPLCFLVCCFYLALICFLGFLAFRFFKNEEVFAGILFLGFLFLFFIFLLAFLFKMIKSSQ